MVFDIDDILIAVFLTLSLILIVLWYVAILKWRKVYLARIFPCVKMKSKPQLPHEMDDFKYPSVRVISQPNFHDNPQFLKVDNESVNDDLSSEHTNQSTSEQNSNKYRYKIDSNNNMIIDSNNLKPDLSECIIENLKPINNMGGLQQLNNVKELKEESYRRYNDMIRNQVEESSDVLRF